MKIRSQFLSNKLLSNERGLGALFYGVFLMAIFIITSMVINVGYGFTQRQKLQHAVDATAIGVGEMAIENTALFANATELRRLALERFSLNLSQNGIETDAARVPTFIAEPLTSPGLPDRVHVSASMNMPSFLISLFQGPTTREAFYQLSGGGKPVIAALVMDVSSYNGISTSTSFQAIRTAAGAFVAKLSDGDYFSLVTFGDVYCSAIPISKIVSTSSGDPIEKTRAEIATLIAGIQRNCEQLGYGTNNTAGVYVQGGLFRARKEILAGETHAASSANAYNKYAVLVSDCRINRSSPLTAPISDSMDLDTITKPYLGPADGDGLPWGQCLAAGSVDPRRAAAIHQADLMRRHGIEVLVVSVPRGLFCPTDSDAERTLRRIAYDSGWNSSQTPWTTDPATPCGGYTVGKWCIRGRQYYSCSVSSDCDTSSASGDGECSVISSASKTRYWRGADPASDPTIYSSTVADSAARLKGGLLTFEP